jgi:hypothetical protein
VEVLAGAEHELGVREPLEELLPAWELEGLPDLAGRLALDPGAVGEQAADRRAAVVRVGEMRGERVVQVELPSSRRSMIEAR